MKQNKTHELLRLELEGTLDETINQLQGYKEKYSDYTNLRIIEDRTYDGGYYYDLYGDRLETDLEEAHRLKMEKSLKNRQLEYERKQYEALKAKFDNN